MTVQTSESVNYEATRRGTNRARHLPGHIYDSEEIYALEKERIFFKDWLAVGRVEELPKPGDFMTLSIVDQPIVVTRNAQGQLGAYNNVCVHRGVEVATGSGNTKEFMCPYHGWLYDLDGRLVGAPYMKEVDGFDAKSCRLKPLKLETWQGWMFVNFAPAAAPLKQFLGNFGADYDFLHQDDCVLAERHEIEFLCNWKLIVENLLDFYHVSTLHASTIGRGFDAAAMPFRLHEDGRFTCFYQREPLSEAGMFPIMPPMREHPKHTNSVGFLPPNFNLIVRPDYCRPFIIWPLGVRRCKLIAYPLFRREDFARADFASKTRAYRALHEATLVEDLEMVQSLQNAMGSRNFQPGPMSFIEGAVHHAMTQYLDRMFGSGTAA